MEREKTEMAVPFAIISDIHANLEALQAVLADIDARHIDTIVCLGDVVGYGANPVECWQLVEAKCDLIIMGNHDQALTTMDMPHFHPRAKTAIEWTRRQVMRQPDGQDILESIENLPDSLRESSRFFVHGSPAGVTLDYLLPIDAFDRTRMRHEFAQVDCYAFNGHSHIPGVIESGSAFHTPEMLEDSCYRFISRKAIINVGSVGQPRDNDPRACYVTVEEECLYYHRIAYDIEMTMQKIFDTKTLDPFLGRRLLVGR